MERVVALSWIMLLARTVALCLIATSAIGCASDRVLLVDRWRVQVEGAAAARDVVVPADLANDLPSHVSRYRLTAIVAVPDDMRNRTLTLAIPYLMAPVSLRLDGREVASLDQDEWG